MDTSQRILIVDDEPNVRLVFRTALEAIGYQVTEAGDGDEALEQLRQVPTDLILLDLKMPRACGMETLARLRDAGDDTPVIIITAHGSVPDAVAAMKLGALDFLPKPISPTTLRSVTAQACARAATRHALDRQEPVPPGPSALFEENLRRCRLALERREFDDAEFFLRVSDSLRPGTPQVQKLRQALQSCRLHPDTFSFRAVGELLQM